MTTPSTTTTTSTSSALSQNQLQQTSSISSSKVVGNYATSATSQPYIAPQIITFNAHEMRPNIRVHIFFDGVNIDKYCAPGQELQEPEHGPGLIGHYGTVRTGNWGDAIYSTYNGQVWGQFNVPEGVFKTGAGIIQISDVDNLNSTDKIMQATTLSGATFVSGNLPIVKSIATPTTTNPVSAYTSFNQSVIDPTSTKDLVQAGNLTDYFYEFCAQSFKIPDNLGTPGVIITSIDLYFRSLGTSGSLHLGDIDTSPNTTDYCSIYICEMKDGYPDESAIIPGSQSFMPRYFNDSSGQDQNGTMIKPPIWSPINLTTDASTPTTFYLDNGTYFEAGKEYAIVVRTNAGNPKFYLWEAADGSKDVLTGQTMHFNPTVGGYLFYGGNGQTYSGVSYRQKWTKIESSQLKFRVNAAKYFGVGTGGQPYGDAYFQETARDYLTLYNITFPNQATLGGILPGDLVYLAQDSYTDSSSANVVGHDGSTRMHWGVVDHYDMDRQILYVDTSNMSENPFWIMDDPLWPGKTGYTRVRDTGTFPSNSFVQIHRSSNNYNIIALTAAQSPTNYNTQTGENLGLDKYPAYVYVINGGINNSTIVAYANTGENYNPRYNTIVPQFTTLTPPGTSISFELLGTSNTGAIDVIPNNISHINTELNLHDYERMVVSRSTSVIGNNPGVGKFAGRNPKSLTVHAHLTTDNPYLTPVIDTARLELLAVRNLIDPISSTYEEFYNTGSSRSKYISQIITLAEGQDAEDLQVILSAYRPPSSDIQVWVKFLSAGDSESLSSKTWTPLKNNNVSLFCDPSNEADFKDFTFSIPYSYPLVPTTGTITTNSSCTAVSGSGTKFQTEIGVGWYINMAANSTNNETSRKIVSIASNTSLVLETPFTTDHTGEAYYIVPPPTSAWLSQNTSTIVDGLVTTSTTNNAVIGYSVTFTANTTKINNTNETIALTNANTYFNPGNRVYYSVPAGNTAIGGLTGNTWYYIKYSNTTTISLTDTLDGTLINLTGATTNPGETHELVSTNFNYWYQPGSIIDVGGDSQVVVSVANDTYLTVGTPWIANNTDQPAYLVTSAGLTYENSSGAIYSKYKKFQIKVILQSNDTSKVPLLDNLRALSLQL